VQLRLRLTTIAETLLVASGAIAASQEALRSSGGDGLLYCSTVSR
jgi:hypothetical protein